MKQPISFSTYAVIGTMLFGLFFGAGNLIFPIQMGQLAGTNFWSVLIGFLITAIGLPFLGVMPLDYLAATAYKILQVGVIRCLVLCLTSPYI